MPLYRIHLGTPRALLICLISLRTPPGPSVLISASGDCGAAVPGISPIALTSTSPSGR